MHVPTLSLVRISMLRAKLVLFTAINLAYDICCWNLYTQQTRYSVDMLVILLASLMLFSNIQSLHMDCDESHADKHHTIEQPKTF